jgi:hypothetical protein
MPDHTEYPPAEDLRYHLHSAGWTTKEAGFTDASGSYVHQVDGTCGKHELRATGATAQEAWFRAFAQAAATGTLKRLMWRRDEGPGYYQAELDTPAGMVKLSCLDTRESSGKKWMWKAEWPTGEIARGYAPTLGTCKELCERAGVAFEPFGDGFRKKEGYA